MTVRFLRPALPAVLLAACAVASAQGAPRASRPDPLDAGAAVPKATYTSSLTPLRAAPGPQPMVWRDANDAVARIGGWRAYAREAQAPEAAAEAAPAPMAARPAAR